MLYALCRKNPNDQALIPNQILNPNDADAPLVVYVLGFGWALSIGVWGFLFFI